MFIVCDYASTYTLRVAQPIHIRHLLCEIWGYHGGVYEEYCLQGCDATKYQHLRSLNHYGGGGGGGGGDDDDDDDAEDGGNRLLWNVTSHLAD